LLSWVKNTKLCTVLESIAVSVSFNLVATAITRLNLQWISWAKILKVLSAIAIVISLCRNTARAEPDGVWHVRALIVAIRRGISIGICIILITAAQTRQLLGWIVWAEVFTILVAIIITVIIR
jgi:hypothetical protein